MANKVLGRIFAEFGGGLGTIEHKKLSFYAGRANRVQSHILKMLMRDNKNTEYGKKNSFTEVKNIEDYQQKVPLSVYDDYAPYIDRMVQGEKKLLTRYLVSKYAESSGSVGKPKVVPLTARTLWVCQCFSFSAPVGCAVKYFKRQGRRLPPQRGLLTLEISSHRLPNGKTCSCLSGIPLMYLKPLIRFFVTSPKEVMFPTDSSAMDMQYLKLRFALADRNVSYLGTMIITVLETMMRYLESNWEMLCDDIEKGIISDSVAMPAEIRAKLQKRVKPMPERAEELRREFRKGFDEPIVKRIWPKVEWLYGMGAGTLSVYRDRLRRYTADLPMHYMGYGASEALIAVPMELDSSDYVILPQNGFYEFLPVGAPEGTKPLTISQLTVGEDYEVILTNLAGLYRYRIEDVVRVTGYFKESPTVTFMYRLNQVLNIAGEKTSQQMLDWAVAKTNEELGTDTVAHSVFPDLSTTPGHYRLFAEPEAGREKVDAELFARTFDKYLSDSNLFIAVAKDTRTLGDTEFCWLKEGTYESYKEILKKNGANLNQIKPVCILNTKEKRDFFLSRVDK